MADLSLIVAAYRLGARIERCLDSILNQDTDDFELIVVDDASDDDTADRIEHRLNGVQHARLIRHPVNCGLPAVRNTGWKAACGRFLWHLDGDDYLPDHHVVRRLLTTIRETRLSVIRFGHWIETSAGRQLVCPFAREEDTIRSDDLLMRVGGGGIFTYAYRAALHQSVGLYFVEGVDIGEDQIFSQALARIVPTYTCVHEPLYVYDKGGPSMMRSHWSFSRFMRGRIYHRQALMLFADQPQVRLELTMQRAIHLERLLRPKAGDELAPPDADLFLHASELDLADGGDGLARKRLPRRRLDTGHFERIFRDAECVIHLGAHKTATSHCQETLLNAREDLALRDTIVLELDTFRASVTRASPLPDRKTIQQRLAELAVRWVFDRPRRIIISDENLVEGNPKGRLRGRCIGCLPDCFSLTRLQRLLDALEGRPVHLVHTVRNYSDYLVSQHSEHSRHFPYVRFEDYFRTETDGPRVSWIPLIDRLAQRPDTTLHWLPFEACRTRPDRLASWLAGYELADYTPPHHLLIRRPTATAEAHSVMRASPDNDPALFVKLDEYFTEGARYQPLDADQRHDLDRCYADDLKRLRGHSRARELILSPEPAASQVQAIPRQERPSGMAGFPDGRLPGKVEPRRHSVFHQFQRSTRLRNREGIRSYDCLFQPMPKPGLSAMIRVRNEEQAIEPMLIDIIDLFDEIVLVDNASTDSTVTTIATTLACMGQRARHVRVYSYPFQIARCGDEHFRTPADSVHSLVHYYNWCLSQCQYDYVWKWDADMRLPASCIPATAALVEQLQSSKGGSIGQPKAWTVFRGLDGVCYYRPDRMECEPRIFPNRPENRFVKDVLWERIAWQPWQQVVTSEDPCFIEHRDCGRVHHTHWDRTTLSWGSRKIREDADAATIRTLSAQADGSARLAALGLSRWQEG